MNESTEDECGIPKDLEISDNIHDTNEDTHILNKNNSVQDFGTPNNNKPDQSQIHKLNINTIVDNNENSEFSNKSINQSIQSFQSSPKSPKSKSQMNKFQANGSPLSKLKCLASQQTSDDFDEFVADIYFPRDIQQKTISRDYDAKKKRDPLETDRFYRDNEASIAKRKEYIALSQQHDVVSPKHTNHFSPKSKKLASDRNEKLIKTIVGNKKIINITQLSMILKRFNIPSDLSDNISQKCKEETGYNTEILTSLIVQEANSDNPSHLSRIIKSSISNMKQSILRPSN